jgi:hypothetical protein
LLIFCNPGNHIKGIVSRKFAMLFLVPVGKLKLFKTVFTLTIFKNIVVFMSNFRRKDVRRQFFIKSQMSNIIQLQ